MSSAKTMSAELRATAVPEPIATPISALLRAGASFTPSPVIATTYTPWPAVSGQRKGAEQLPPAVSYTAHRLHK